MAEAGKPQEFTFEEKVGWSTLMIQKGQVIEIYIPKSNLTIQVEEWCSFVVLNVNTQTDGSMVAEVRFMGRTDGEVSKLLEEEMNGRGKKGPIHFCPSQPCTEVIGDPFTIHILQARVWNFEDFTDAPYVDSKLRTRVRQWLRRDRSGDGEEEVLGEEDEPQAGLKRPAARRSAKPKAGTKVKPRKEPGEAPGEEGKKLSESMRDKLRGRLREVREKAASSKLNAGMDLEFPSEEPDPTTPASEDSDSDCAAEEKPNTGSSLVPRPPALAVAVAEGEKKDTKRGKEKVKEVERKKKKKKRRHREEPLEDELRMVASNVTTSGSLRTQLVRRAVLNEKMTSKEKKRRRGKKDAAKKLREALTDVLSPKESRRKKEKERKKKKKRRLADGVIESCSSTCSSSSVEEEEDPSSTSEDLETPMKKRSRDKPGSVLKMLTQHVQEQLEQAATTELETGQNSLTGGVKIQTYFALQIRPSFQSSLREMREMHHLSHVMDALRRGERAKVGDALAARFMAIHQSLLDQNWATAKFMEIFPLEEASAASSSMVLATRKHTKMVAKMQGFTGGGSWYGPPRKGGKGGKGQWYNYGDQKGKGKDSKGKGKKGKGRGKGKNDWSAAPNEWKHTKDKPEEK